MSYIIYVILYIYYTCDMTGHDKCANCSSSDNCGTVKKWKTPHEQPQRRDPSPTTDHIINILEEWRKLRRKEEQLEVSPGGTCSI